ncbi:uncharacterized protein LOC114418838 isoform X3 [Glycine soja]|uniref:tRNA (guanine(46)-N(7))-methyltransferase n=1 Tax=Glycine soja TaxID=3848 RepID=A0A0B2RLB7_GLYSO|nr:uncharacterized protein LOC114418838 isoform X3 [Glycine soja]KHN34005.1 tRNA (guanine-N(7)-)-methyltransferase [Glycine soja]RZC02600.1 tRNA (guanine-N(7)-)-methyltransferase isoform A [Glycine soja]
MASSYCCSRLLLQSQSWRLMLRFSPFLATSPPSSSLSFSSNCHVSSSAQLTTLQQQQQQPLPRSSQLVALEYADLNLSHNLDLGHVRIRQHVNPLSSSLSVPAQVPEWNHAFADPTLPLMVDIGCGSGRFLMWLAKRTPKERNFLGLEIRQKIVKRAESWAKDLALDNVHFLFANATISFKQLVESYPGPLALVSILCPDPHFKKRHHKRRVLQKPLVDAIVDNLMPGGQVFTQSDVFEMALDMRNQFDEVETLKHIEVLNPSMLCDSEGWLLGNPMGIRTEREIHAEHEGAKIYRRLYQKPCPCQT